MSKLIKYPIVAVVIALSLLAFTPSPSLAADASLSITHGTATAGSNFTVQVNASISGFSATGVGDPVVINYDSGYFSVISKDFSSGKFPVLLAYDDSKAGLIKFSAGILGGSFSGTGNVMNITLHANKAGNSAISISPGGYFTDAGSTTKYQIAATSSSITVATVTPPTTKPVPVKSITPVPVKTTAPAPSPSIAPAPSPSPLTIDPTKSTVSYSSNTAVADNTSAIAVCVTLRDGSNNIVSTITPTINGLRDTDTQSPFVQNSSDSCWWQSQITSSQVGLVTVSVSADNIQIALSQQDLQFTDASPAPTVTTTAPTSTGLSAAAIVAIVVIILLIILALLFIVWRKLKNHSADDEGYDETYDPNAVGDEPMGPEMAVPPTDYAPQAQTAPTQTTEQTSQIPVEQPVQSAPQAQPQDNSEVGRFDPNEALRRSQEPIAQPPQNPNQPQQ